MTEEEEKPEKPPFTKCNAEAAVKFNEIPASVQESGSMTEIALETENGAVFQFAMKSKNWRKFLNTVNGIIEANPDAEWIASAGGKLAGRTKEAIRLEGVGIRVFERQPTEKPRAAKCSADVTLKFNRMPVRGDVCHKTAVVILETQDGQQAQFAMKGKSWRKFKRAVWEIRSANSEAQWLASAGGRLVRRTNKGFILEGVGVQVFERKPRL